MQQRAYDLWQADKESSNKGGICRHPEYYWNKAQDELVSPFIRALADEAGDGIIFKPGSISEYPFEFWRYKNDYAFASARIETDTLLIHGFGIGDLRRYNLHLEKDTEEALEYLRWLQRATFEMPGWPDTINPCGEIPLSLMEITKGYPSTRVTDT